MVSQLLQKSDNMEDNRPPPSSYNEEECKEKTFPIRENDKVTLTLGKCESDEQQSSETKNIIASAQTQTETECTSSENRSKSSADDLYNRGPNPQEVSASNFQNPSQRRQTQVSIMHSNQCSSTVVSKSVSHTPRMTSAISLEDKYEEFEDYDDNASSDAAIEFQSSPEKESGPRLKRSYNRGEDSDTGPHSSVQCSLSPDRPRSNSDSAILISDISENGASPQVNKESKQTKAQTKPSLKLSRSHKNTTEGDSGICMDFENKTSTPSGSKGMKYFETPPGDRTGQQTKSMANLSLSKEQVISSNPEKGDSIQQDTAVNEYIEKVIEWFPDACRKWIKKKIETIMHRGKEVYLDDLASTMVDGLYPKSSQNEAAPEPENNADDNNGIKPTPSVRGQIESGSSSNTRLRTKVIPDVLDKCWPFFEIESMICPTNGASSPVCGSCERYHNTHRMAQCCEGHLICGKCLVKVLCPYSTEIKCPTENCMSTVPERGIFGLNEVLSQFMMDLLEQHPYEYDTECITDMENLITYLDSRYKVENNDYHIVTLDEECLEYRYIKRLFSESMSGRSITAIRRVQNPHLWQKFSLSRARMVENFGFDQLNERHLFHGTNIMNFDAICREGLDWRKCGGGSLGQGTYFAKNASLSDMYSGIFFDPRMTSLHSQPLNSQKQMDHIMLMQRQLLNWWMDLQNPLIVPSNNNSQNMCSSNYTNEQLTTNVQPSIPQYGQSHNNGLLTAAPEPTMTVQFVTSSTEKVFFTNVRDTFVSNKKYMFVARVLVGRSCTGNRNIHKPPADPDDPERRPFNSCVDNVVKPSVFVIFDSSQSYPEYIVEY